MKIFHRKKFVYSTLSPEISVEKLSRTQSYKNHFTLRKYFATVNVIGSTRIFPFDPFETFLTVNCM